MATDFRILCGELADALVDYAADPNDPLVRRLVTETRSALCEADPEPVCWQWFETAHFRKQIPLKANPEEWRPLFTRFY
jgi:hypothetical protein